MERTKTSGSGKGDCGRHKFHQDHGKKQVRDVGEQGGNRRERRDTGRQRDWGVEGKGWAKRTGEGKRKADKKEDNNK